MVTGSRINGDATNKEPVVPVINTPVVRAALIGDKSSTCPPTSLHLLSTTVFEQEKKSYAKEEH